MRCGRLGLVPQVDEAVGIVGQVVQFAACGPPCQVSSASSVRTCAACPAFSMKTSSRMRWLVVGQGRDQRDALHRRRIRRRHAGQVEQGGHEVDRAGQQVSRLACVPACPGQRTMTGTLVTQS